MARILAAALAVVTLLAFGIGQPWSAQAQATSCAPEVRTAVSTLERVGGEVTAMTVSIAAKSSLSGGDRVVAVTFTSVNNGVVEISGQPYAVPGTYTLSSPAPSWSFVLRKATRDDAMLVHFVVRDLCGEVQQFAGMGRSDVHGPPTTPAASTPSTPPTSTPTPTSTKAATNIPTATAVPPTATAAIPSATPEAGDSLVTLGVAVNDVVWTNASLDQFDALTNRRSDIVQWYQPWGQEKSVGDYQPVLDVEALQRMAARGSTPMITWEVWGRVNGVDPSQVRNIPTGAFDAYIDSWANGLRNYGRPVYLRLFHEMNGDWYPWSYGVNGNSASDLIAAWRYVHGRFQQAGATNVIWVWCPNLETDRVSFQALYPGDAYVDWLAVDGYNRGTRWSFSSWTHPTPLFQRSLVALNRLNAIKPIMIAETSSVEEGGDKAAWVSALYSQLPVQFPQIHAIIWFHYDMSYDSNEADWRLNTSSAAVAAYTSATSGPTFAKAGPDLGQ